MNKSVAFLFLLLLSLAACDSKVATSPQKQLGPSVNQLKDDMKIIHAMGIRLLRTYNTKLKQTLYGEGTLANNGITLSPGIKYFL